MPLPKPQNNERKSEFITRCMENLKDKGEFPDSKQRLAVCYNQFEESKAEASIVGQIGDDEILYFDTFRPAKKETS